MNLAIFDLDHTLIHCDSDNEWPRYLMQKGVVDEAFVRTKNDKFYQDYLNGCLDIDEFLAFQLEPLSRFDRATLNAMHAEFMRDFILPNISQSARNLVAQHQQSGDTLLMISATNEFIITPIAHEFGITEIIGVSLETDANGNYTGRYVGTPSFKEGKITRLHQWLQQRGQTLADYEKTHFYSDSRNDLPLLETVSHPVAVHPDDTLRQIAQDRGWPILDLSD